MEALIWVLVGTLLLKMLLDHNQGEKYMARLDTLNAALDNIDTATTELASQLTQLVERVSADDISPEDLQAAVERASALATRISDASTSVAGIEPTPVVVPDPVEEIPVDGETPEEEVPGDGDAPVVGDNGVAQPGA
jgi:hypothetical protein